MRVVVAFLNTDELDFLFRLGSMAGDGHGNAERKRDEDKSYRFLHGMFLSSGFVLRLVEIAAILILESRTCEDSTVRWVILYFFVGSNE